MAKAELGEKRRCLNCSTPFFDLKRAPIVCPKCATVFQVVEIVRSSPKRTPFRLTATERPAAAETIEVGAVLLIDEDEGAETAVAPIEDGEEMPNVEATL